MESLNSKTYSRRNFTTVAVAAIGALACKKRSGLLQPVPTPVPSASIVTSQLEGSVQLLDWTFPKEPNFEPQCVVLVPKTTQPNAKFPLLIALHGLSETVSPKQGAYGWPKMYELTQAFQRIAKPPLTSQDFKSFVTNERLNTINQQLHQKPFQGLVVACPYVPASVGRDLPYETYAQWLTTTLLPRLQKETPILSKPSSTGIDGVSFGGITALHVGLMAKESFGAIGSLQAAIASAEQSKQVAEQIRAHLQNRPLHIVTSSEDAFRNPLTALHDELDKRNIKHEFLLTTGPHDYAWNQGPGCFEMLLWHDRILRS